MLKITTFMNADRTYSPNIQDEMVEQIVAGNATQVAQTVADIIQVHNDAVRTLADITETSDRLVKLLNHAADLADTPEVPPKKKRS